MYDEFIRIFDNLSDIAWNCYYKAEIIRGYCENTANDNVSSPMMCELIREIRDLQRNIITKTDEFTTNLLVKVKE